MLLPLSCRETKIVFTCHKNFSRKMENLRCENATKGTSGGPNGTLNRHAKLVCYTVTFINRREMLLRFMGVKLRTFWGGSCPFPEFHNFSIRPMLLTVARQNGIPIHKFNLRRTKYFFSKIVGTAACVCEPNTPSSYRA